MLVSIVHAYNRFLANVLSITLSDSGGTYGIRRCDTREVVVPAGTALDNPQPGLYQYDSAGLDQDTVYEIALTVVTTLGTKHITFRRYLPLAPVAEPSLSESVSDSPDAVVTRGIKLEREPLSTVRIAGRGDLFLLRITATDAVFMPSHIFSYQRKPADPRTGISLEEFMFVATPFDATIYPIDAADPLQRPAFYRKDILELLVPSSEAAESVWLAVQQEVKWLVAAYNRLDYLTVKEDVLVAGSSEFALIAEPDEDLVCELFEYEPGEEAAAIQAELDDAIQASLLE